VVRRRCWSVSTLKRAFSRQRTRARLTGTGQATPIDITQTEVAQTFISDEFGSVLRAHAPVRDHSGQIVGAVMVEAPAIWVDLKMRPIRVSALFAMLLAVLISVPAALLISRNASRPLLNLHAASGSHRQR